MFPIIFTDEFGIAHYAHYRVHGWTFYNPQPDHKAGTQQGWTTENAEIHGEQRPKLLPQRTQRFAEEIKSSLVFPLFSSSAPSNGMVRPAPLTASQCARMETFHTKKERDEP